MAKTILKKIHSVYTWSMTFSFIFANTRKLFTLKELKALKQKRKHISESCSTLFNMPIKFQD